MLCVMFYWTILSYHTIWQLIIGTVIFPLLCSILVTTCILYYLVTCLSGLVIFYLVRRCSITTTATTSISGTTTGTLSISGFPSTTTSGIHLAFFSI
jgi:hypothetical protein